MHSITMRSAIQGREAMGKVWQWARPMLEAGKPLRMTIEEEKRTLPQNARMWACLSDIAQQVVWHGQKLAKEDWKEMLTASFKAQRAVPGVDGGFVVLGQRTSDMSKSDMSELMELIEVFGAQHGVRFRTQEEVTA